MKTIYGYALSGIILFVVIVHLAVLTIYSFTIRAYMPSNYLLKVDTCRQTVKVVDTMPTLYNYFCLDYVLIPTISYHSVYTYTNAFAEPYDHNIIVHFKNEKSTKIPMVLIDWIIEDPVKFYNRFHSNDVKEFDMAELRLMTIIVLESQYQNIDRKNYTERMEEKLESESLRLLNKRFKEYGVRFYELTIWGL